MSYLGNGDFQRLWRNAMGYLLNTFDAVYRTVLRKICLITYCKFASIIVTKYVFKKPAIVKERSDELVNFNTYIQNIKGIHNFEFHIGH